jgi:hypothetical protein
MQYRQEGLAGVDMTSSLQVMLSREISASKFSETFDGGDIVSARCIQGLQETSQSFEHPIDRYPGAPAFSPAISDEVNSFESRYSAALVSVGSILRAGRQSQIGKSVVERLFWNLVVYLNLWIGYSKNEAVHEEASLKTVFSSALLGLVFRVRNSANGVILVLSANLHRVPVPSYKPLVKSSVNDDKLTSGKGDVSDGRVCGLLNGWAFAPALPALFTTPRLQRSTVGAWVIAFFGTLVGRLNSIMFTHGVAPRPTANGTCDNSAASPLLYQQGDY